MLHAVTDGPYAPAKSNTSTFAVFKYTVIPLYSSAVEVSRSSDLEQASAATLSLICNS